MAGTTCAAGPAAGGLRPRGGLRDGAGTVGRRPAGGLSERDADAVAVPRLQPERHGGRRRWGCNEIFSVLPLFLISGSISAVGMAHLSVPGGAAACRASLPRDLRGAGRLRAPEPRTAPPPSAAQASPGLSPPRLQRSGIRGSSRHDPFVDSQRAAPAVMLRQLQAPVSLACKRIWPGALRVSGARFGSKTRNKIS